MSLSEYTVTEDSTEFLPRAVILHTPCGWKTPMPVDVSLAAIMRLARSHDCAEFRPAVRRGGRWQR